ncbi:hypothetical protein ACTL6U_10885 [Rhodovibrionaceae bacterium A322]
MLQKDLAEANRQSRRESFRTIALLALLVILAGLGFWTLPRFLAQEPPAPDQTSSVVTLAPPTSGEGAEPGVLPVEPLPSDQETDAGTDEALGPAPLPPEPLKTGDEAGPASPLPPEPTSDPAETNSPPPPLESLDQAAAKAAYLAAFKDFTEELEPRILTDDFASWNGEAHQQILSLKNKALTAFGSNQMNDARQAIEDAADLARTALASREQQFQETFTRALQALEDNNIKAAEKAWSQASAIQPDGPGLAALKNKIDVFAPLQAQLEAARIARVENKPQQEIDHLQAALRLDPDRPDLKERIAQVEKELKDKRYADAIQWGMDYVRAGKKDEAAQKLGEARDIYPEQRPETDQLAVALINLALKQAFDERLKIAEKAEASDDWQKAKETYEEILKVVPGSAIAKERLGQAKAVLTAASQVQAQLDNVHRLSVPAARRSAEALLQDTEIYGVFSPAIKKDLAELQRQLDLYAQEVPLEIISDGKTFVSLRSIGKIGLVEQKTITLLPGKYRLEGQRDGYKSKLIPITLEPGGGPLQVRVICDEQL